MKYKLTRKHIVSILVVICITVLFTIDLDNLLEAAVEGYTFNLDYVDVLKGLLGLIGVITLLTAKRIKAEE